MRRQLLLPVLALTGALVLAGCSSDSDTSSETSATSTATSSESATASDVEIGSEVGFSVAEAFGETPTVVFDSETPNEGLQVEATTVGDGEAVAAGAFVVVNYAGLVWGSDTTFDSSFDRSAASGFSLTGVVEGWGLALEGQTVGSRVLISIPPDLGYGSEGNESAGIGGEDTIVFVVDIIATYDGTSAGEADATPTEAEVDVEITGEIGEPVTDVQVNDGATEPTEATVTVLATGTGEELAIGQDVVVQYSLNLWDNSGFETSWAPAATGPSATLSVAEGYPFAGLAGVPVGSRVLVTVPADEEYSTPAVAFVLDILGTMPANEVTTDTTTEGATESETATE